MLAAACKELGAPKIAARLENAGFLGFSDDLPAAILNTAKRFGKARFAQITAKHVAEAKDMPEYIAQAIDWLQEL